MKKTLFANSLNTIFVTLGNVNPNLFDKKYSKKYSKTNIMWLPLPAAVVQIQTRKK